MQFVSFLFTVILTITPLLVFPINFDFFSLVKLIFVLILTVILISRWLFLKNELMNNNIDISTKIIFVYSIILVLSTIFSYAPLHSIWGSYTREEGLIALLMYVVLFFTAKDLFNIQIKHIKLFVFSCAIVSSIAILQMMQIDVIKIFIPEYFYGTRITSTIGNRNFLGSYLTLIFPFSFWLYLQENKIKYLLISNIIYLALLVSITRSAWLGSMLSFIVFMYIYYVKEKNKINTQNLVLLLISLVLTTVIFDFYSGGKVFLRFLTITQDVSAGIGVSNEFQTNSASLRMYIWTIVLKLIKERPLFGWGPDTLGLVFREKYYAQAVVETGIKLIHDKAHNEYLQIAFASGLPALLFYLSFITSILKKTWTNISNNQIMIPLYSSIVGYLLQAFFNISVISVAYIFWIFLGALMHLSNTKEYTNLNI